MPGISKYDVLPSHLTILSREKTKGQILAGGEWFFGGADIGLLNLL
jgi:hypothetical protein